jgi:RND family efflux transporter MFP subunit
MTTRIATFVIPPALLLVVGVGWMAARGRATEETDPVVGPLPVETVVVRPVESYQVRRSYTGTVVARRATELSFRRAGELVAVEVDHGDRVTEGQPLARLDVRHLNAKRRQLEAERSQAAAVLAELEAGPRLETIAAARAEVRSLEAQVKLARLTAQRQDDLRSQNATSQQQFDQAVYDLEAVEGRLEAARRRLEEYEAGTRPEQVASQRAVVEGLDAALADLDHDLEDSTLLAPFSGRIAERNVDEGAIVAPGASILRLVEDHHLEAWVGLPGSTAARIQLGQQHRLFVAGKAYPGVVSAVLPELDAATRTRRIVLSFDAGSSAGVLPGQVARLEVIEEVGEPGYWLPTTALVRGTRGLWSCLAVIPDEKNAGAGRVKQRDVEVLHTEGARVLARGTLQPGDQVVAGGTHRVVPGQLVRSIRQDSSADETGKPLIGRS